MKKTKLIYSLLPVGMLLFGACSDDNKISYPAGQGIVIETPETVDCGGTYASFAALFHMKSDARYTNAGYVISENANPTIYGSVYDGTISGDTIKATILDLAPDREYHVRAFMNEYQGEVIYSQEFTFTTAEGSLSEQLAHYRGPQYPDYYADFAGWGSRSQWNLANVHDPSVVKAADGYYYMYQTDASYGNAHVEGGHFHGRRSLDLINWEYLGGTMPELPGWIIPKWNEIREGMGLQAAEAPVGEFGYWAPSVVKVNDNLYRMYYSIVVPGLIDGDNSWGERAFIGLMETSNPADNNSWEDKGYVITNASDKGLDFHVSPTDWGNCYYKFNAIDPSVIITDNGEHWMIYGSWHSGIAAVKLNPETGKVAAELGNPWGTPADIAAYGKLIATRQMGNRWQGSEGPEVIYKDGYYYLFLAYDALDVAYNTRVARSKNIDGPYLDMNGTNISDNGGDALPVVTHPYKFANSDGWVGFSHCTVFNDGEGNWFYASQARFPAGVNGNDASNALMLGHVRSIVWTNDGWPLVLPERYGAVPQLAIAEEELIGNWELIDLAYSYGNMKESVAMSLTADHKINGGTWDGADWSFDSNSGILKAGDVNLYLKRECDWEDANRRATIVFAGLSNTTWWGKKSL
ncbi:MAG: arabinan endo-1,5-alpha-L-arabinosidase [Muribaculaceae bacterium]|nr:arabinan endo-1,5-alpha-L-arabinosidase [Muribaculaceae bacterium]